MNINNHTVIANVVADNYKTAAMFKQYGIDFCCSENNNIEEAATKKKTNVNTIINELLQADTKITSNNDYQNWTLDFLCDYIYQTHSFRKQHLI